MARAGVKILKSDRVGMHYDLGENHVTRSGMRMPAGLRDQAMHEIAMLVESLWPSC